MKRFLIALSLVLGVSSSFAASAQQGTYVGKKKGLVILVEFPKRTATNTPAVSFSTENAREFYDKVANQKNFSDPATGFTESVYDYFYAQSEASLSSTSMWWVL